MAYGLVETIEVGAGGASSIEFTSIPQTGQDLVLLLSARSSRQNANTNLRLGLNGSSSNFARCILRGNGSGIAITYDTDNIIGYFNGDASVTNSFGNTEITIANYTGSTNKSIMTNSVAEDQSSSASMMVNAIRWANTSAVTSITLIPDTYDFERYSTASLYIIS
jgi:hypothetical protein